jgi:hypothetical protein
MGLLLKQLCSVLESLLDLHINIMPSPCFVSNFLLIIHRYCLSIQRIQSWHGFSKTFTGQAIKTFLMNTNLTLDEMILQYSENPFIDEKMFDVPAFSDSRQKHKILARLMLIAGNLFNKIPETGLSSYKRRYEIQQG